MVIHRIENYGLKLLRIENPTMRHWFNKKNNQYKKNDKMEKYD